MAGSLHVGTVGGIRIDIHYSWLLILALLTLSLATTWFPAMAPGLAVGAYWLLGLVATLLLFASVLVHELAHSFVARARGLPVKNITLFIFGGVSNIEREPPSAGTEFLMAVVGPLASLALAGLAWLLALAVGGSNATLAAVLGYLAIANLLLGVFNLIPGFPLDGGRVLRSILWGASGNLRTATVWAARVGQVVAFLFILWGIWQFFTGNVLGGLWIGFIGWFLLNAAQSANAQAMVESLFRGVAVGEVMGPPPPTVPADLSLRELVEEQILPQGRRTAFVARGDQLAGLVTLGEIRQIPRERWGQTPVGQVMIPAERLRVVAPRASLADALSLLGREDINQLPVVEQGRLVGVLSRDAIVRYLEVRRGLGLDEAERRVGLPRGDRSMPAAS